MGAARSVSAGWVKSVVKPDLNSRPELAVGCRLNEKDRQPRVLHMPERVLRLNGPSLEIIERCDGKRTVREIVAELQAIYSQADPAKVESDILGYLELLQNQRALDFVPKSATAGDGPK
jgi:pyrroloquinoline quinone biosynthesis protein D